MTATHAPATAASWPPGLPRSLEYPRGAGRVDPAGGRAALGRPAGVHRPRRPAHLHRAGRAARTPSPAGWPTTASAAGDVVAVHIPNCRQYPPLYYGILLAGATFSPTNPLLPAADLAAQLTDAGATRADHLGPGAAVRPRRARRHPRARRSIVTGEAHILDFAARLTSSRTATSTPPTCSPPTPPTGTWTPTSTRPPTSRTWPTPAARPASARASSCRTATSSPTCCSRPAGRPARVPGARRGRAT